MAWPTTTFLSNVPEQSMPLPTRTLGFAINGEAPKNASSPQIGALRGYVFTKNGVFNEIVTKESVVPLNKWIHVVFTRSLTTGMHIYVNGQEQAVYTTYWRRKSLQASISRQNEIYIGHDSICTIDELKISNTVNIPCSQYGFNGGFGLQ